MKPISFLIPILLLAAGCSDKALPPTTDDIQITIISGNTQTGAPGAPLPTPIVVRVDRTTTQPVGVGPAEGVEIVWTPSGSGSTAPARSTTNSLGLATTTWTLGPAEGAQSLSARDVNEFAAAVTLNATALGNGCPATGGTVHSGTITVPETWGAGLHRVNGSINVDAELTIQAGARICMAPGQKIEFRNQGRLNAIGTQAEPIVFSVSDTTQRWLGLRFISVGFEPSFVNDVQLLHAEVGLEAVSLVHPIRIDRLLVRGSGTSALLLSASGCEVTRSTFDGTAAGTSAVSLFVTGEIGSILFEATVRNAFAAGITAAGPTISLTRTEITGCGGDGLVVPLTGAQAANVKIENSNLFGNDGLGIRNLRGNQVDARFNWWGDPAGPNGPSGDGVSSNVDTSFSLTTPVTLGPRP